MKKLLALSVLMSSLVIAAPAFAGGGSTSQGACGSAPAGWNVPNGALAFSRGAGAITDVINAVGEYRTHVMMSHGPGGWVSHAAMHTPGTNDVCAACDNPMRANELQDGYPGVAQVYQGGIYYYTYGDGAPEALYYQNGNRFNSTTVGGAQGQNQGAYVANQVWSYMGYSWVTSKKDSNQGLYRLKWDNGNWTEYSLHGFKDLKGAQNGQAPTDNGTICSGFAAYAEARYLGSAWYISTAAYDATKTKNGLNALRNAGESQCNGANGFWTDLGAGFSCFFCDLDTDVCDDAGRQLGFCMQFGTGNCGKGGDSWYVQSGITANTISPDRVAGWSGHSWSGAGYANTGDPIWAYDNNNSVQWNQGGSVYGCWF